MTAPARITQADMDRAMKAIANAGIDHARVIMRLAPAEIEIIVGETANDPPPADDWNDDDI